MRDLKFLILLLPSVIRATEYSLIQQLVGKEYYHRKLQKAEHDSTSNEPHDSTTQRLNDSNSLSLMGTKTFGISVGSRQSPSFNQSMQISMNGTLSEGMRIEGTLRDDNTPLQPDGTTQELKVIDKMYVNVRTEKHQITLGDFEFNSSQTQLGKLDRQLEGILGNSQFQSPNSQLELGAALSKGKWTRKEIIGITGKQGPYELCPANSGVIVAGSDRIWVNGQLKTRGKDYTIDYSAATITFTPLSPISQGDLILTEFQHKDESYRRTTLIGVHKSDNLNALVFKEEDMKNNPLSFAITPDRLDSLSKADSSFAWISGVTYVGEKKGSYIKTDSIYKYVVYPNGDYEVSFTRVKVGDYEFNPLVGGYEYVGSGNGNYIPKIMVPLPQSNLLLDVRYETEVNKIKFGIEGGATKFKPNTFAHSEQIGKAVAGLIETNHSKWAAGASFRNLDETFTFPGTTDTLEPKIGEVFLGLTPTSLLHTDTRIAKTPADLKRVVKIKFSPQKLPSLSYLYFLSNMKTVTELCSYYQIRTVEPFIRYEITNYKSVEPLQTNIIEIGVRSHYLNLSSKEVNQAHRLDSRTSSIAIYTTPLTLAYTYKQTFTNPSSIGLGNLKLSFGKQKLAFANLAYDLTSLERKTVEEEYYRVAPGKGSFSRDSTTGRYYPDPHGDYEKRLLPSDKSSLYKNFNFSQYVTFPLDQEIYIKIGATKQGEGNKIYFWKRTQYALDDKNRISLATKVFDIYATYTKEDYRANRTYGIMTHGDQTILDVNFRPHPYELTYTTRTTRDFTLLTLTYQEGANTIGAGTTFNISNSTLHFLLQAEERKIDTPPYSPTHLYGLSSEPTITYQFGNSMSTYSPKIITTRLKVTDWFTGQDFNTLPPNIRVIYPPGISFNWGIDFTVLAKYTYTISYQGTKIPSYPTDHTLNAEIRINF